MKKSDLILAKIDDKKKKMQNLLDENKVKEAHDLMDELDDLEKEYKAQKKVEDLDAAEAQRKIDNGQAKQVQKKNKDLEYKDVFIKAFKGKKLNSNEVDVLQTKASLSTGTDADGGYLIPEDMETKINELKRSLPALEKYVRIVPVNTDSGSRVLETDAISTPFNDITEGSAIGDTDSPQFTNVSYTIKDKGGILPVPNNLLNDSDQAVKSYLERWMSKKSVATRNGLIMEKLNTLTKVPVAEVDDVKKALNVTLDPAISKGAKIFTNQSGFQWLDTLKDNDGNYLLQSDPTDETKKRIKGREVVVFSDKIWANSDDSTNYFAPLVIGDLKEAIALFDRKQMSLLATKVGGDAFKFNRTDIRAIEREDVAKFDDKAVVFGKVEVGTV